MPKINKKKSNYLTKNGGNSIDLYMGDGVSVDDNVDTKIYFVIIDTTGDGYSYDDATKAGQAGNAVIIKELKDSSVKIYSVDIDEFKKMGEIAMLNKRIKLANGEEFVEILSSITAIKGYVSVASLGFDELKRYYLLINIKEPIFAKEYPGSKLPNYYHILESLDTLPEKYYDTLEEKYAALNEKYKQIIKSNETPLEVRYEKLEENYKILEKKNETLQSDNQILRENEGGVFKYKELQDNYNELHAAHNNVSRVYNELVVNYDDLEHDYNDLEHNCKIMETEYYKLNPSRPNPSRPNQSRPNTSQSNPSRPNQSRPNSSRPNPPRPNPSRPNQSRPNQSRPNADRLTTILDRATSSIAGIKDVILAIFPPNIILLKNEIDSLATIFQTMYRLATGTDIQLHRKIIDAHRLFRVIGTRIPNLSRFCQLYQMEDLNRLYKMLGNQFDELVQMFRLVV